MMKRPLAAAAVLAAAFWVTGCSVDLPWGDGSVSVDEDGVSVGNGDGEVSVDSEGDPAVSVDGDGSLTIASADGTVTEDCEGRTVNVTASAGEVVLNGTCERVNVLGSDMTVHVGSADTINVVGADNTVYHATGEPSVIDVGTGNEISAGGDAQA
ncbi:DUF3060 domain-containing protein [Nocardiopsis aegyptia]|uniref:DUF3060 domain-containing protein n=1 Tax=Nocardiopsis aegyptia TaxID=220378 RepID=UPI003672494F